jgi:Tfp pilus assembly protein PilX
MADTPDGHQGDTRPIPDPTALTTEANLRMETSLRNFITTEIKHQSELFMSVVARIEMRLDLLDGRTAEQKSDTKAALDAALAAQKEAVASQTESANKSIDKSETATTERIKGVEALLATSTKATDDKITDLKDRVIAIEAVKLGTAEGVATVRSSSSSSQMLITTIGGIILVVIAAAGFIIAILKP